MRVAGPSLALSLLLFAAPALAQGGGYYDSGNPYNRQQTNQNRYEYYPPPQQDQTWQYPAHQSPWQQNYSQQPGSQGSYQPPQSAYGPPQMGPMHMGPSHMGHMGASNSAPVSSATQGQIKSSLESSGFKNVTVLPQSYLIRATAPDGSRILMQVSSDGLYGVVVNPTDQAASSATGGSAGTGGTGGTSSTGTGGSSGGTGATSSTGTGGTSSSPSTGSASSSTGGTSSTGTGSASK